MRTREEAEKIIPKTYEEAMNDNMLSGYLMTLGVWCKLIDLGFVKDLDSINGYLKDLWEKALRERLIKEITGELNADK